MARVNQSLFQTHGENPDGIRPGGLKVFYRPGPVVPRSAVAAMPETHADHLFFCQFSLDRAVRVGNVHFAMGQHGPTP